MKSSKVFIAIVIVILLAFFSGSALAGIKAGTMTLSPRLGIYNFDNDQGLEDGVVYALGIGKNFTDNIAAELVLAYIETDEEGTNTYRAGYVFGVDCIYNVMPDKQFDPFIALGIASITLEADRGNDSDFIANAGAGINAFITDTLAIRGDVRYARAFNQASDYDNFYYTLGVTYVFGGN